MLASKPLTPWLTRGFGGLSGFKERRAVGAVRMKFEKALGLNNVAAPFKILRKPVPVPG